MGLMIYTIKFDSEIPSFTEIRERFAKQTGLTIYLEARLNLSKLPASKADILEQLHADYPLAIKLARQENQQKDILALDAMYQEELHKYMQEKEYEKAALLKHKMREKLETIDKQVIQSPEKLHTISSFHLAIPCFYDIEFTVEKNTITINRYLDEYYAIISFLKVLYDSGGKNVDTGPATYPKKWNKLKPWDQYSWYNRPKK